MVRAALDARAADPGVRVPWSGFDLINTFNRWKVSEDAGRLWAVDGRGEAELVDTGLVWRQEVPAQVFEEAAVDLGRALAAFSASRQGPRRGSRVGFPRYRHKDDAHQSFRLRNRVSTGAATVRVGVDGARSIRLPKIGVLRVREDTRRLRRLLRRGARIWYVTISGYAGRWTITVTLHAPDLHPARRHPQPPAGPVVGVDVGLLAFAVAGTADREQLARIVAPKPLAASAARLRRRAQALSRAERGSQRRKEARLRLARTHRRVANQRANFLHQVSNELVKSHDRLAIEHLTVANLMANRHLARAISDAAWGEFARQLAYKAAWYAAELHVAPRSFPSTRMCSACGEIGPALSLGHRTFACGSCGLVIDRDLNAAANLARWAQSQPSRTSIPDPHAGGRVTNARRGTSADRRIAAVKLGPQTRPNRKEAWN